MSLTSVELSQINALWFCRAQGCYAGTAFTVLYLIRIVWRSRHNCVCQLCLKFVKYFFRKICYVSLVTECNNEPFRLNWRSDDSAHLAASSQMVYLFSKSPGYLIFYILKHMILFSVMFRWQISFLKRNRCSGIAYVWSINYLALSKAISIIVRET